LFENIKLIKEQDLDSNILTIFTEKKVLDLEILIIEKLFKFNIWLLAVAINLFITFWNKILSIAYFNS